MPTNCWPSIRGLAMRVTKVDACGNPVAGPKSSLISDGFISISLSPQYEDGEETRTKNAAGLICINDKADDQLVRFEVEASLCGVNPDLFTLVTGQAVVLNAAGDAVGNRFSGTTISTGYALEVWTDIPSAACESGDQPFGYFLLPFLKGGRIGDFTIEEAAANFTLTSSTRQGSGWGVGPYDVVMNEGAGAGPAVPGPLVEAIGSKDHFHMEQTTVAPPTVTADCAAKALVLA